MHRLIPITLCALLLLGTSCRFGSSTFNLNHASVESRYVCPRGSNNTLYNIHASTDANNGTSSAVTIDTVTAVLTLTAVHGSWLQQLGSKYDAGQVSFAPAGVAAGANTTLHVTIPSACTNESTAASGASFAEYRITLTVKSSAGTFRIDSQNRHRITAA